MQSRNDNVKNVTNVENFKMPSLNHNQKAKKKIVELTREKLEEILNVVMQVNAAMKNGNARMARPEIAQETKSSFRI